MHRHTEPHAMWLFSCHAGDGRGTTCEYSLRPKEQEQRRYHGMNYKQTATAFTVFQNLLEQCLE